MFEVAPRQGALRKTEFGILWNWLRFSTETGLLPHAAYQIHFAEKKLQLYKYKYFYPKECSTLLMRTTTSVGQLVRPC